MWNSNKKRICQGEQSFFTAWITNLLLFCRYYRHNDVRFIIKNTPWVLAVIIYLMTTLQRGNLFPIISSISKNIFLILFSEIDSYFQELKKNMNVGLNANILNVFSLNERSFVKKTNYRTSKLGSVLCVQSFPLQRKIVAV